MLKLRRGTVIEVGTGGLDGRGRRRAPPRLGRRDDGRAGRDRRRRGRQHRGARPRARLRRLRHRPREPVPGARRRRGRARRPRDEAELQLAAACRRPGRAARRFSTAAGAAAPGPRPAAARPPGPGRVVRRGGARRAAADRLHPGCRRRPAGIALGRPPQPARARVDRRGGDRIALATGASARRSASSARCTPPPTRGSGTRSSSGRGRGSSDRRPVTGTAGWRRSRPPTQRWRSACRRSSPRGCRRATRGRATSASATTPARSSTCCWPGSRFRCPPASTISGRSRRGSPPRSSRRRAGAFIICTRSRSTCPDTRSRGFRSGPWAGPSTRIGCSSPPRLRAAPRSAP